MSRFYSSLCIYLEHAYTTYSISEKYVHIIYIVFYFSVSRHQFYFVQ